MVRKALISVSDKTGVVELSKGLKDLGIDILSTGGTAKKLRDNNIDVTDVSDVTGFPECLDGRVKTLHPVIHAGILAMRDNDEHMKRINDLEIEPIDLVIINLYPFRQTILKDDVTLAEAIENIDIGGPTMLRSAAKNYRDVAVVIDPTDYEVILTELKENGEISLKTKYRLSLKVFEHTAQYDAMIATYLRSRLEEDTLPDKLSLTYEKVSDLRYGENPHQKAAFYKEVIPTEGALTEAVKLHGKELSFNNINDANGALDVLREFEEPTVVGVKHTNACGVGSGIDVYDAYMKAYESDPMSIFGGIIASNRVIDARVAEEINSIFIEIVIAPGYDDDALEILKRKKNIRILELDNITNALADSYLDIKRVNGGILVQDGNKKLSDDLKIVTDRIPTEKEMKDLEFALKICKHIKSNGIVLAKDGQTVGVGPGQVNRIWAVENSIRQAKVDLKGSVMASDAFFPFDDCVKAAAKAGITAIIQPGGAKGDKASIDLANKYGIAMVFTGIRHFKH